MSSRKDNKGYVSRAALKLKGVLEHIDIDFKGKTVMDVGSSHGGFVQVELLNGASKVYAVDVGRGILNWKLRNLEEVEVMEGVNARDLRPEDFAPRPDIAVVDVSFISLKRILPVVFNIARREVLALVKPQFEATYRESSKKGGVIDNPDIENRVIEEVKEAVDNKNWEFIAAYNSPLKGKKGNREYFLYYEKTGSQ
ncbi:MAG: TlyA family RNA methyltransferase [Elusimicrobiota bacterium]|nr:TlyA family RNA methyltransferase [Elusimicrobiota bacterium]